MVDGLGRAARGCLWAVDTTETVTSRFVGREHLVDSPQTGGRVVFDRPVLLGDTAVRVVERAGEGRVESGSGRLLGGVGGIGGGAAHRRPQAAENRPQAVAVEKNGHGGLLEVVSGR